MTQRSRDEIRAAIFDAITTIAPETDTAAIVTHQPLRDQIDLDSFDFLNVIVGLHERLGVDIPESDYGELTTLDSAIDYLARRSTASTA
jgi:acyl carrier protein